MIVKVLIYLRTERRATSGMRQCTFHRVNIFLPSHKLLTVLDFISLLHKFLDIEALYTHVFICLLFSHWVMVYNSNYNLSSVFSLRFLSLGHFYKILQNWESSCTKMIASRLKNGSSIFKKSIFFDTFSYTLLRQFSKVLGQL